MPSSSQVFSFFVNTVTGGGTSTTSSAILKKSSRDSWTVITADGSSVALSFDVMISLDYTSENSTIQSPIETNGFATYNKKIAPARLDLEVAIMGEPSVLQEALQVLSDLNASTDLVNVVTPEREYRNLNLEKVTFSRTPEDGVDVIYASLSFIEVKEVQAEYSSATLAKKKNRGQQQAQERSAADILIGGF